MSQSQFSDAFLSVRLVVMDHYLADPVAGLDPLTSERGYEIRRVPILRVFGSTPAGQRTTLHLHGLFPYLYVPFPEREATAARDGGGFVYRLAASIDLAINLSLNQSRAAVQHVYKASVPVLVDPLQRMYVHLTLLHI
jgi:DNA polymerase zeta